MEIIHNTFMIFFVLNLILIINLVSASKNFDLDHGDYCVAKDNVQGICMEIIECDYAKQLFRQRKNSEIMSYRCKFRGRMLYVCCPSTSVSRIDEVPVTEKIEETTSTKQVTAPIQNTIDEFNQNNDFESMSSIENEVVLQTSSTETPATVTTTEETSTVALRSSGLTRYQKALCENETPEIAFGLNVVGGDKADIGEFTFHAAIGFKKVSEGETMEKNPIQYLCGGSLIADDVVITAAHCFGNQYNPEVVRLGRTSLDDNDDDDYSDGDDVEIEKVIIHPEHSRKNKLNDIALIKLKRAVNETRFPMINHICLSTNDDNLPENFTITGFGISDIDTKKKSDWLIKATVNEHSLEDCNEMMLNTTTITETQTCALGHKGADSCQGDSGGPMSYNKYIGAGKLTYLHGIVSYGASCGSAFPGIYTKVNKYLGWIEQELNLMEK